MYECIHCRGAVKPVHIEGRYISPSWVHEDGYEECRPTFASPNFNKPLDKRETTTTSGF